MAGCLERLAPYVRASGTPRAAAFYRDSVGAFWTGHGELAAPDAERIAAIGAKLTDLYEDSIEAQLFGVVVGAAEAARQPTAEPMEQLVAWTVDLWSELGPEDDDWGDREAQAQRDTLAMTQQRPASSGP
ncbi:hypothetical protein [Micromonospora sp. NPDC050200]|uniref:hypothetical protein n=1 Tax=Micromonospora sp. NPDC050200 TaxID=3155664 RepID=UPI0033FA1978